MKNFATATKATATALNSSGSAAEENAKYLESIEARVTAVSAAFQQMSLKVVDSDLVKGILDIVKAFAQFGSTDFGSAITQITLLSGVSWGGLQLLGNSILPGTIGAFKTFNAVLKAGSIATVASAAGTSALAVGLSASLPIILGVTAAIVGLTVAIKALIASDEAANPSIEELYNNMQEANASLKTAEENYQKATERLQELNATPFEDRTTEMQAEIDKLESLIEYYEALIEVREGTAQGATADYITGVEQQGIKQGVTVTSPIKTGKKTSEGLDEVIQWTQIYRDEESAIIGAATALAKYNNTIVDIDDQVQAKKELQKFGVIFSDNTITVNELKDGYDSLYSEILKNKKLNPSLISQYEDLTESGKKYAEALQEQKDRGIALTKEQQEYLDSYNNLIDLYNVNIRLADIVTNSTNSQTSAVNQAASALSIYAQNLLAASAAYQLFKAQMEATGDYDDGFKGLVSVFGELNGEYEKGQVGSRAFLTALELLTGQSFDSSTATEYLNEHLETLNLLFGDSESGGTGLITAMQKLQAEGKLTGASIKEVDGNLEISVDSFSDLADSLGISESSLYALTQALKVMGIDFEYGTEDILDNVSKLGDGIVENLGDKTIVNFEKFVEKAQEAGMSTDEISQIGDVLSNASNVDLTNVNEGLTLLESSSGEASGSADDLTGSLEDIGGTAGGIDSTASSMQTLSDNISSAAGSATSLYRNLSNVSGLKFPSLFGMHFAEGTDNAPEGDSLVNEEGPELIQSGDKAYIAGNGNPAITHLNKGDIVYTADETKNILRNRSINDVIQSHKTGIGNGSSSISLRTGISSVKPLTISASTLKQFSTKKSTGGSSTKADTSSSSKSAKEEFDEWLKAKKHALAMDEITEEEYYTDLEKMNEKYFKDSKEYQDEYWRYQEEVYKWRKSQLENENKLLQKQIDLEKALSELAKAKEQKILVYKDGRFQYVQDIDAIDEAQRNVSKLKADLGYASGTSSSSAGIHLVGENGPELRVLNSGDGIIPADATKNLLSLAQMSVSKLSGDLNKAMQVLYSFNIDNLSLPDVTNASEFFEGLKNYAYQYSYAQ